MEPFRKSDQRIKISIDPRASGKGSSPLALAAQQLAHYCKGQRSASAAAEIIIAVPSARAGRRLSALLAEVADPVLKNSLPEMSFITPGELIERLVVVAEYEDAPELLSVAWERALVAQQQPFQQPSSELTASGTVLAPHGNSIRALVALRDELSSAGYDIRSLSEDDRLLEILPERIKELYLQQLLPVEEAYEAELKRLSLVDRWSARREALEPLLSSSTVHPEHGPRELTSEISWRTTNSTVVLVGCTEIAPLAATVLRHYPGTVVSVVFAPEGEEQGSQTIEWFDELGFLQFPTSDESISRFERTFLPGAFSVERISGLPAVAHAAVASAAARKSETKAAASIKSYQDKFDQTALVTIGVPARGQRHVLTELVAQEGRIADIELGRMLVRDGQGRSFSESRIIQFLNSLLNYQSSAQPDALQALIRAATMLGVLPKGEGSEIAIALDTYIHQELPTHIRSVQAPGVAVAQRWITSFDELCAGKLPFPSEITDFISIFSANTASEPQLAQPHIDNIGSIPDEFESEVIEQLSKLWTRVQHTSTVENASAASLNSSELMRACITRIGARTHEPRGEVPAIELLGWLELFLDEAPELILVDPTVDLIPGSASQSAFIGEQLRALIGLPTTISRGFRDRYRWWLMTHSGRNISVMIQEIGARGEPLILSPALAPLGDAKRSAALFASASSASNSAHVLLTQHSRPDPSAPQLSTLKRSWPAPKSVSVSGIGDYLVCPYRFALTHLEKLEGVPDSALEFDNLQFGSILHAAIDAAIKRELKGERFADAATLERFLSAALDRISRSEEATGRQPASRIQLESARTRLARYAEWHMGQRAAGWEALASELPFEITAGAGLVVKGRIDRVERRDGEIRLLDVKTSENAERVDRFHRKGLKPGVVSERGTAAWSSLQLPLYRLGWLSTAQGKSSNDRVELGLLFLTGDSDIVVHTADWDAEALDDAAAALNTAAQGISSGVFWPPRAVEDLRYDRFPFVPLVTRAVNSSAAVQEKLV